MIQEGPELWRQYFQKPSKYHRRVGEKESSIFFNAPHEKIPSKMSNLSQMM